MLELSTIQQTLLKLLEFTIREEIEDDDTCYRLPPGWSVEELACNILKQSPDLCYFTIGQIVGKISEGWGNDVGLAFYHMKIKNKGESLYILILNCFGHGVSLLDDYSEEFKQVETMLRLRNNHAPVLLDQHADFTTPLVEPYLMMK